MFYPEIILGPPGTGKTTYLLNTVQQAMEDGVKPEKIGYMAFTRKASMEAVERAKEKFGFKDSQLIYFRTLHSLAFRLLGIRKPQVLSKEEIKKFAKLMGMRMSIGPIAFGEGTLIGHLPGDRAMFLCALARMRCIPLQQQWDENNENLGWYEVDRVDRGLRRYKEVHGLVDFTDMLEQFLTRVDCPELDLLVIDEAQDLSQLQWRVVHLLAEKSKRVIVAGDDDQAIFQWAGADIGYFINLEGDTTVLDKSYRIPRAIQGQALKTIEKVLARRDKKWEPRDDEGAIHFHNTIEALNMNDKSWLVLARNGYLLDGVEEKCRREGLIYERGNKRSVSERSLTAIRSWETLRRGEAISAVHAKHLLSYIHHNASPLPTEGEYEMESMLKVWGIRSEGIWHEAFTRMPARERSYLVAALRKGEKITKKPRIVLSTIHSAKGGEADNVVLFMDMARRTHIDMMKDPDDERRVFYVGLTRAKESLHILNPSTRYYFTVGK